MAVFADNWPQWRGPEGTGVSAGKNLPLHWGANENVRWRVPLPDRGNSTPEINQLAAFTNELAAQRGKKITPAFADRATGWTNDLIARIKTGAAR